MNSKLRMCLALAAMALISAGAVQAQPGKVGSALDSIAVPVAVQDEVARVRAQGALPAAAALPEEWQQVAAIRAAQTGRPVAELVDAVRQALRPSPALVPTAENRPKDAGSTHGAPTPIITVGGEGDSFCNFLATAPNNGLQQAMDAAAVDTNGPGLTEIRVANSGDYISKNYILNGASGDQTVRIIGGYASCGAATPTPGAVTTLDGSGPLGVPVLLIDQVTAAQTVYMENLRLINGSGFNGGGLEIRNNNLVIGTSLIVTSNASNNGGGINLQDSADADSTALWLLAGSVVSNNTAGNGGGIYCQGDTASGVVLDAAVALNSNTANTGGGFYLNGCALVSFASLPSGIFLNSANSNGGGGFVDSGGRATLIGGESFGFGDASRRTTLDSNSANAWGGGLYVTGAGSLARSAASWIAGNSADADGSGGGNGGGVSLDAGAAFLMDRALAGGACHDPDHCSQLSDNSANIGGAVSARGNGTSVDIRQTWIQGNSANAVASGVVLFNGGGDPAQPATLFMEGDMIVNNPTATVPGIGQGVVHVQDNTNTTIAFTTFADNLHNASGDDLIAFDNNINLNVYSSIFRESIGKVFSASWDADTHGFMDCAIVFESATLPPVANQITVADPQFEPPGPFGPLSYRLSATSPAVDYCDTINYTPVENDIDGQARGFDVADIPDLAGPYDLGADELRNLLFADGFEATP